MGCLRKNAGACQDWPDPCLACGILMCIERDRKPSEVISCVPKRAWIRAHSLGLTK
jgi:hypothetical protein